jgi:class 3 adenylate cyclase/tetratricopeptide (TPR) repeat protein
MHLILPEDIGMQCSSCRVENSKDAKFCNQCGAFLGVSDQTGFSPQSFDEKLAKIQRYLPQGLTQKILSQRDRIEGEHRHVTVMFCDMEGFTPLVERLGAEAAYTVMGQIYEILIRQVHDYEGTINEMTGDGIMALFGAPIALEEAPQRALWAARAIHREIAVFNNKKKELGPIRMRIGVHSGPVVVGSLGSDLRVEFKAVGDTVNLASRMECLADPGTTFVTQEVYKQTQDMFEFENMGKKIVKGKAESIQAYKMRPSSKGIHRPRLGSERMIFSEMVGRKSKLDKLELQVMKLINGEGSIVTIRGEAGIGKSRLLAELKQREVVQRLLLLEGRAVSMGRNLSFHPMVDLLKQWARIGVEDSVFEAFAKLETAIRKLFQEGVGEVLPFVATLMGMNLPEPYRNRIKEIEGEALEKLIRKSMRELFTRMSEAYPLMIVIDDLHWSDKSSIELLESLFRLAEKERILFINLFRPGYPQTGNQIIESLKATPSLYRIDIELEPLDDRNSETLIANMLNISNIHHAVVGQIVKRAGGNPYFIEEVVRSFIDQGAVVIRDGNFEVTPKFSHVRIPDTINDVLMARIDQLEEETRDLLKVAAVIGRSFFYRVLSEVATTVRNLDERLSFLKETQLIQERRRMEELEYLFSHALAQEAAYASIMPEKRRALHLRVAATIEKVFAEKLHAFYGMLAYHYSRAESLDKTEEMLIKAGEAALKTSASSEALTYYLEALSLYRKKSGEVSDQSKIALLEKNIALALYNRGQYEESLEYFDKAIEHYWGPLPKNAISLSLKLLFAYLHFLTAIYVPSLKFRKKIHQTDAEILEFFYKKSKALSIIDPKRFFIESIFICKEITSYNLSDFNLGLMIYVASSSLFSFTGLSIGLSRKILKSAKRLIRTEHAKIIIIYDTMETFHNYIAGNWREIGRHDLGLVHKNLSEGEIYLASQHLYWHGCPCIYRGAFDQAHATLSELSMIAEVYENDFSILLNYLLKIKLLTETRHLNFALGEVNEAIEFARKKGFTISLLDLFSSKARILTYLRDIDNAVGSIQQADAIRSSVKAAPIQRSIYYRSQFEVLLFRLEDTPKRGNGALINDLNSKITITAKKLIKTTKKAAQHRTEAYRLIGQYYWLTNKPNLAFKWFKKSVQEGERLEARLELSRTYYHIGKLLMKSGRSNKHLNGLNADAYLDSAQTIFEELDLQWDLNKLSRIRN